MTDFHPLCQNQQNDVHEAKTRISMGIHPNWFVSAVRFEEAFHPLPIKRTAKTDQTGHMPRLIWVFAGRTGIFVGIIVLRLI